MRRTPIRHTLALLRSKLNLGQKELADLLGCTFETIKSVELGRLKLSDTLALRVSMETGVRAQWLTENNLKVPIKLSFKAVELQISAKIKPPDEYTKTTFELVQAHKLDRGDCTEMYNEQLNGLMDLVRLRGIIESAREQHLYELARYKVDRFLNDMEKEFHSNPSERFLKGFPVNHVSSLKFAISELERAKLTHWVNASDPPEETPEEWEYVCKEMATMEVVSPYANRSDSQIAAQIKAHLERELGRS